MKYKLKAYGIWEYGQRKDAAGNPHQEDSTYPLISQLNDDDRLFIVCDGMGGHDAGEVASATVCEAMAESIMNDPGDSEGEFTRQDFNRALDNAFNALDAKDTGGAKKMGTTMTFLKLHSKGATIAHMGDSRVYHIRPGKDEHDTHIMHVTTDHSLVNDLIKMGEMTHEEARHSNQKNVITRAMQPAMDVRPQAEVYNTTDIKAGDYFYLCTDGMLELDEMEDGSALRRIFSQKIESDEARVNLLRLSTSNNRDNHTAFIVHITEVIDPIATPPAYNKPVEHPLAAVDEDYHEPVMPQQHVEAPKSRNNGVFRYIIIGIAVIVTCAIGMAVHSYLDDDDIVKKKGEYKEQSQGNSDVKKHKGDKEIQDIAGKGKDVDDTDDDNEIHTEKLEVKQTARTEAASSKPQIETQTVEENAEGDIVTGNPEDFIKPEEPKEEPKEDPKGPDKPDTPDPKIEE